MPHRIDPLLARGNPQELERFLSLEAADVATVVSLARTELRIGSAAAAAEAFRHAARRTADLRCWLGRVAEKGIELAGVCAQVAELERAIADLRECLGPRIAWVQSDDHVKDAVIENEHEWQRTTDHPSARALLGFLEADLNRGLRLAWRAEIEWNTARRVTPALLAELDAVQVEIQRWVRCARQRRIATAQLDAGLDEFVAVLASVRGLDDPSD